MTPEYLYGKSLADLPTTQSKIDAGFALIETLVSSPYSHQREKRITDVANQINHNNKIKHGGT